MKRFMAILLMLLLSATGFAFGEAPGYTQITAEEAKAIMDAESDVVILDVRTQEEYDGGHIPGAMLIPDSAIAEEAPEKLPDKGQKLLVYCRSGRRSKNAAAALAELGYTKVFEFGGILDWPYEVVMEEAPAETVLTLDNFEEVVLDNEKPVLIHFWADWCGPCKALEPILAEIIEARKDEVVFCSVDVDEQFALADAFEIESIPTLILIRNNEIADGIVGLAPKETIEEMLK